MWCSPGRNRTAVPCGWSVATVLTRWDSGFARDAGSTTPSTGADSLTPAHGEPMPNAVTTPIEPFDVQEHAHVSPAMQSPVFQTRALSVSYGGQVAVEGVDLDIRSNEITALIGPSGCGKSTVLRCFNRMNDLIPGASVAGSVLYHGEDLYARGVDPVEVRRRIGMVFQRPNPFPKSIYDNIAFGPRVNGRRKNLGDIVERALTRA